MSLLHLIALPRYLLKYKRVAFRKNYNRKIGYLFFPCAVLLAGCKIVYEPLPPKAYEVVVKEKGSDKPIINAAVSLVRGPGSNSLFNGGPTENDFSKLDTKTTNAEGRAKLFSNAGDELGVIALHPDYIPFFRSNAWGFVSEIHLWPFARLKVRLKRVNNYDPQNRVTISQWADAGHAIRPKMLNVPDLPVVADTTVYMIGLGNDSNFVHLRVKRDADSPFSFIHEVKSKAVYVAKGDTAEISIAY